MTVHENAPPALQVGGHPEQGDITGPLTGDTAMWLRLQAIIKCNVLSESKLETMWPRDV